MEGIREEFSQLDGSTATPEDDIPEEKFKSTIDVHVSLLTKIIRSSFQNRYFPDKLKAVEVTPIFKKSDDWDKGLTVFCLICERCLTESCISKLKMSWKANYQNCLQSCMLNAVAVT